MIGDRDFIFPSYNSKMLWNSIQAKIETSLPNVRIVAHDNAIYLSKPQEAERVVVYAEKNSPALTVRITQNLSSDVGVGNGVDYTLTKNTIEMVCNILLVIMGLKAPRPQTIMIDKNTGEVIENEQ